MLVLEARFHPQKKSGASIVVVGRVFFHSDAAVVEQAARDASENASFDLLRQAMLEKLRFLVQAQGSDGFQKLKDLKSDFWSFVEVKPIQLKSIG